MRTSRFKAAAATMLGLLTLAACSTPRAKFAVQHYVPLARSVQPLGELHLSNTRMALSALEGEMKLQYVGLMPDAAGDALGGAQVYRARNASRFFRQNAGRNGYCAQTPLWVALNSKTGAPAWSKEIWVGLLTLPDWAKFTADLDSYCAGGTYVRAP